MNREINGFSEVCTAVERALQLAKQTGEREQVYVAVDGMCGSGKSTLGEALLGKFGGNLFHMDDFFLRPEQRTKERYMQPGGNVDYERFRAEVLEHLADEQGFSYKRFDCRAMELGEVHEVTWSRLNIIEGAYSCHPYFGPAYHLRFFLEVSQQEQRERILARNGAKMWQRFEREWIPMENRYFAFYGIREQCVAIPVDIGNKGR